MIDLAVDHRELLERSHFFLVPFERVARPRHDQEPLKCVLNACEYLCRGGGVGCDRQGIGGVEYRVIEVGKSNFYTALDLLFIEGMEICDCFLQARKRVVVLAGLALAV